MSRTDLGDAPASAPPARRAPKLLRSCSVALAVVLTAAAMWLVVTSTSRKSLEIGVLLGLWAIVVGASAAFGNRQPHDVPTAGAAREPASAPVTDMDVRSKSANERSDEAAERRAFQNRLEEMVRAELRLGLAQDVAGLRSEVAGLRREIVENLGGQLILERIEKARLIGSDLEALHQAVRQLRLGEPNADSSNVDSLTVTEAVQAPPPAGPPTPQTVDAEVVPEPGLSESTSLVPSTEEPVAPGSPAQGSAARGAAGVRPARSGRRHREDDSQNDTLARILAREGQRGS